MSQPAERTEPVRPLPDHAAAPLGGDAFHLAVLQTIPLFARLQLELLRPLAAAMQAKDCASGEVILAQGGISGALYVLQSGHAVMVRTDPEGREFILGDLRAGDHFGEMSLVDGLPHSASVVARQRCRVLLLRECDFAHCLATHQGFCVEVLLGLTRRLRQATGTIASLALVDVRGRIAQKLIELSQDVDGQRVVRGRLSRTELAKRVGASREMVSRVLSEMQAQGLFALRADGHIVLNVNPGDGQPGSWQLPEGPLEWPPTEPGAGL